MLAPCRKVVVDRSEMKRRVTSRPAGILPLLFGRQVGRLTGSIRKPLAKCIRLFPGDVYGRLIFAIERESLAIGRSRRFV